MCLFGLKLDIPGSWSGWPLFGKRFGEKLGFNVLRGSSWANRFRWINLREVFDWEVPRVLGGHTFEFPGPWTVGRLDWGPRAGCLDPGTTEGPRGLKRGALVLILRFT